MQNREWSNSTVVFVCVWRLIYNRTTHATSSPPGVDVRVPGFGKTYSLEYLDPSKRSVGKFKVPNQKKNALYRRDKANRAKCPTTSKWVLTWIERNQSDCWFMTDMFAFSSFCFSACLCLVGMYFFTIVQSLVEWGYTRDDDVRGAPYDWRKAPSKQQYIHRHTTTRIFNPWLFIVICSC